MLRKISYVATQPFIIGENEIYDHDYLIDVFYIIQMFKSWFPFELDTRQT